VGPSLTAPACNSTLSGTSQTFTWTAASAAVAAWWLYVGSSAGGSDFFNSGRLAPSVLSIVVSGLPSDGRLLHLRLFFLQSGAWHFLDCTVQAANLPPPTLSSPSCGSTLAGSAVVFTWTDNGAGVTDWWLYLGTSQGASDLLESGDLSGGTTVSVSGLPTDGQTIYVRLWYRTLGRPWHFRDCTVTAATLPPPALTSPSCGSSLTSTSAIFSWADNGTAVKAWWLYVGTSRGGRDLLDSGLLTAAALTLSVSGLPDDGRTVYVRLWYRTPEAVWRFEDCTFSAVNLPAPTIASPACGSSLTGSVVTFEWADAGHTPVAWWLYVGSSPGANDLFDSGRLAASARSITASRLPIDGRTLYVRLFYLLGPTWGHSDCALMAFVPQALTVSPRIAALTFTRTQQFTASLSGSVTWLVDGVVGGSSTSGTITSTGLYSPPNSIGTHAVTFASPGGPQSASATVFITNSPGVFTYHNDNQRTGLNPQETVLTPANVTPANFGRLFSYPLDGIAYAAPLYVENLSLPNQGFHNVVYVATEHDSVYAFDADGLTNNPLWQVSFINPAAGVTTVPAADTGTTDISPEIGITGTPVIDPASSTLYVVSKTKETVGNSTTYVQRLHALDLTTGAEKLGGPVVIQASVSGNGDGSQGGQISFVPLIQNQRPALLLSNGVVYVGFASHGDNGPYHGWVLGFDAATLQLVMTYNTTPNGSQGGIWQGGGGLAADSTGNIYFVTGNGTFDADSGGLDYGDSIVKISPSGAVLDYFTPHDQSNMNLHDLDLGSGGPLLLPDQSGAYPHLLVTAGKTGTIYVVNRDKMGGYNPTDDSQIPQALANLLPGGTLDSGNFKAPVYFAGFVYFGAVSDSLRALKLGGGSLSMSTQSPEAYSFPGATIAISANGNTNAILWALERPGATVPAVLHAYDATNLGSELYNSNQVGSRDTLDYAAKYTPPVVVNGKVFVASVNQLAAYGPLP
jgi:hypothetical protein